MQVDRKSSVHLMIIP